VEIAHLKGSRGAKGCLHYLFRRDASHKPLSVRGVQFPLIYSLKIGSWIDPGSILAILTDPIQQGSSPSLGPSIHGIPYRFE
jgi:phage terminase large subunit-like protein